MAIVYEEDIFAVRIERSQHFLDSLIMLAGFANRLLIPFYQKPMITGWTYFDISVEIILCIPSVAVFSPGHGDYYRQISGFFTFRIDFVSLFWGASKCRFPRYLLASLLGILPRVVLFTILGDGIYDYIPIHLLVKIIICAIPVGVAVYVIRFFLKRRKQTDA